MEKHAIKIVQIYQLYILNVYFFVLNTVMQLCTCYKKNIILLMFIMYEIRIFLSFM